MALYPSPEYQTSFESIGLSVQEKLKIECQAVTTILDFWIEWFYLFLLYKSPR